ncbi:DUF2946 domain-containing protein [Kushneria aurantia]|uniref:DUF2946 domain-containing protein n=1 Tax=Kushneria aurantia TaxID=504092 RepID=A0ABV6G2H9_9GAMM|nr:DUF2946 domain-containing protein [Kushneria aurantia]
MPRLNASFAARLALAALLIIFIAPVVSQSLAALNTSAPHAGAMSHGHHHQSASDHGHHHHTAAADDDGSTGGVHANFDSCGYCSLLSHFPLAAQRDFFLPPERAGPHAAPIMAIRVGHGRSAVFPNALSRAPPPNGPLSA